MNSIMLGGNSQKANGYSVCLHRIVASYPGLTKEELTKEMGKVEHWKNVVFQCCNLLSFVFKNNLMQFVKFCEKKQCCISRGENEAKRG